MEMTDNVVKIILLFAGLLFGMKIGSYYQQKKAIEYGFAEYDLTGQYQWRHLILFQEELNEERGKLRLR
jgi:hypothetical protein